MFDKGSEITIKTAFGLLVAYTNGEEINPSIHIDLRKEGCAEDFALASVECNSEEEVVRLITEVWEDVCSTCATERIEHTGISGNTTEKPFFPMNESTAESKNHGS